jgi:hypothetical protein
MMSRTVQTIALRDNRGFGSKKPERDRISELGGLAKTSANDRADPVGINLGEIEHSDRQPARPTAADRGKVRIEEASIERRLARVSLLVLEDASIPLKRLL